MAFERDFAEALVVAMIDAGWQTTLPEGELPNPLDITFSGTTPLRLIIHARRLTPQSSAASDHHRPAGEMHAQMIFDGDQRGAGIRNHLRFSEGAHTLLFGYHQMNKTYVVAAYDPAYHSEYAYSKSLQVKDWRVDEARRNGIAFQMRTNGETIVLFSLDNIAEYLSSAGELHDLTADIADEIAHDNTADSPVRRAFASVDDHAEPELPSLEPADRRQRTAQVTQAIRNRNFSVGIKRVYECCAICGFQYDYVMEAAHIIPVSEGGTDTYGNGLGLCPNCHHMYDRGYILVDGNLHIHINPRHAEEFDQAGLAGSLGELQQRLRKSLWIPEDTQYQPSAENLQQTFDARR